jgi:hypothetical protein
MNEETTIVFIKTQLTEDKGYHVCLFCTKGFNIGDCRLYSEKIAFYKNKITNRIIGGHNCCLECIQNLMDTKLYDNYRYVYQKLIVDTEDNLYVMESNDIQKCLTCREKASSKCSNCNLVYYCSKKCEISDYSKHKFLCKKSLPEYCKNLIKMRGNSWYNERREAGSIHLSDKNHFIRIKDKEQETYYMITLRCALDNEFCVICGKDVIYKLPLMDVEVKFEIKDGLIIYYYRCQQCIESNNYLCKETFFKESQCPQSIKYLPNILLFIFNCKKIMIPNELINLIVQMYKRIKCCHV